MKKNQQSNYFKNKKTDQVYPKQSQHNNRDTKSTPNYIKNDQALNILNLKTHSMFEEQSARVKKYKNKYQNSKTKLIEVQEELNNKIREIGDLLCQVSELQDELDKVKQKDEEKNKKIQYYQQKLTKNEDEILISEHTTKYQFNNAFDMLTNMANLVNQQSSFKGKNEFSIYLKELHSALLQIQKLKVTQSQFHSETNNRRDINKIEAELHLNSLQSKNEDLINQLSESKQQQSFMVSQYKESLQTMQERLQTMRKKIMHIEQNNQQETESLSLQLQQKDLELKDQEEANKKLQKTIQAQAYEMQIMQQHIKNLQIKQDEYAQQLQRMSTIRQSNNIQIKSIDFLTSSEIDLRDEISQLDDDIQKLQIHLQQALHEQTYFDKNQILN